jgi:signal transduction histidine kinase
VLILTAESEGQALADCINAGADDYVTKSGDLSVLKARLKAQLRRRQFEAENRGFREQLLRSEMDARDLQASQAHIAELESMNTELRKTQAAALALATEMESFSYSVSHDLRAPLRSIDGFSQALQDDHAAGLDEQGLRHLERVRAGIARMERLIEDMLGLAKVSWREMSIEDLDLSALAGEAAAELQAASPAARFAIQPGLRLQGDRGLMQVLLHNLLGNAVKFSAKEPAPLVELTGSEGAFTVRDNGVGFDMAYADKLFGTFQRLHRAQDFAGTGVGLATCQRVVRRHGGRLWAEAAVGQGASFHFAW